MKTIKLLLGSESISSELILMADEMYLQNLKYVETNSDGSFHWNSRIHDNRLKVVYSNCFACSFCDFDQWSVVVQSAVRLHSRF